MHGETVKFISKLFPSTSLRSATDATTQQYYLICNKRRTE